MINLTIIRLKFLQLFKIFLFSNSNSLTLLYFIVEKLVWVSIVKSDIDFVG